MSGSPPHRNLLGGFTLIELLVSFAVLAALVTLLASTFANFAGLTSSSGKRLEANNQSRTVFDRMGFDLGTSVRSGEVNLNFKKDQQASDGRSTVNDSLMFLVDARTIQADSRLARIGYEVDFEKNQASNIEVGSLLRVVEPFLWGDSVANASVSSNADRQPLGWGVFRMEFSFLKTDGTYVADPPAVDEMAAVICTTAALDEKTYAQLSASEVRRLAESLPNARDGRLPISDWNVSQFDGFPQTVTQNVRIQQRQFYLK